MNEATTRRDQAQGSEEEKEIYEESEEEKGIDKERETEKGIDEESESEEESGESYELEDPAYLEALAASKRSGLLDFG